MPSPHAVVAMALAALLIALVPGPSVLFVIGRAMVVGRRAVLVTVAGNAAGLLVQALAVAAGLGTLVSRSVLAFSVVKIVGAAYLVLLGVRAIRHRGDADAGPDVAPPRPGRDLRDGFVVGVANPKTIVFLAAFLPQLVDPGAGWPQLQLAVLGAVFVLVALAVDSTWALGAGAARHWFERSPRRLARVRATGGVLIVGLGVRLALTDPPG